MFWKMLQYWERRQSRRHWAIFIVVILGFTALLSMFNGLGQLDRLITDAATRLDKRQPSPEIVIITIDDDSVSTFKDLVGRWPWPRGIHAELLDKLKASGALVVGLDIIMTEPDRLSPAEDVALTESIKRNNPVVLPIFSYPPLGGGGWMEVEKPIASFSENVVSLAHINLEPDSDGMARSAYLREGRDGVGGGVWYHLAAALWLEGRKNSSSLTQEKSTEPAGTDGLRGIQAPADILQTFAAIQEKGLNNQVMSSAWLRDQWVLIPYAGGPGSFQRYSYMDVYFDRVPQNALRGKYVLVGATAAGLGDMYATPMSGQDALMPGVEIIANVLDGLVQNEYRYAASVWQNVLYNVLLVTLIIPLLYLGRPRAVLIGAMCLMLLSLIFMFFVRRYMGIQVVPAASLITLVLAYPFWSWRRLEQAMHQIRMEFYRMRRENGFFQEPQHVTGDRLERDLQAFENASWQLRSLQQIIRQSLDALPYMLMLTDENTQVILSNMQARRFFRVDPPLPTMAFEPAMDTGSAERNNLLQEHGLANLLAPRFIGSLLSQEEVSNSARELLAFLRHQSPLLTEGTTEVVDAQKGGTYLLKIIPRIVTIEKPQGWIVTLVNLSGVQQAEVQRDQVLRYLQESVNQKLLALQDDIFAGKVSEKQVNAIVLLNKQVDHYLVFQYAQTAVYFYEKLDLYDTLKQAYGDVANEMQSDAPSVGVKQATEGQIIVQGDAQMLHKALTTLMSLMVGISRGKKMPLVKVSEQFPDDKNPSVAHRVQVFLMIALKDSEYAETKEEIFTMEMQHTAISEEIDPDAFSWWTIKAIMSRHAGTIKVQRNQYSLGVMIEIMK